MSHIHSYSELTLIPVLIENDNDGKPEILFNKPMALMGYKCEIVKRTELGGILDCDEIDVIFYGPRHIAEEKFDRLKLKRGKS